MEPEENFDSWISLAYDLCTDAEQFEHFLPGFSRLFQSISDTGFLPAYNIDTCKFIRGIIPRIILKLLDKEKPSNKESKVILQFFELCLKLSLTGFGTGDSTLVSLATTIISESGYPLYSNGRKQIYQRLCQFYVGQDAMEIIYEFITERCQSFSFMNTALHIYVAIHKFSDDFMFANVVGPIADAIDNLLSMSMTTNGFIQLPETLKYFRQLMPLNRDDGDSFVDAVTPILERFIEYKSFDHRRIFFSILQLMINDKYLQRRTAAFVDCHNEIMDNFSFHVEFAEAISDIMCGLAREDLLSKDKIRNLWSLHTSRHETEVDAYVDMFVNIAEIAKGECLAEIIECITTSENSSSVWFRTVNELVSVLLAQNMPNEINQIKNKLWEISFDKNHPKIETARASLLDFIGKHADITLFNAVVKKGRESIGDMDTVIFCFEMLRKILGPKLKISYETFAQLIRECIYIIKTSKDFPDELFTFIAESYKSLKIKMTQPYLNMILELHDLTDKFYPFLNTLCDNGVLTLELMTYVVVTSPYTYYDEGFFSFIKHMMENLNYDPDTFTINRLPLLNEELLWRFVMIESPIRDNCEKLLCQMYSSNDGDKLIDEVMINMFLQNWKKYYNLSNNDKIFINLLIRFISEIEDFTVIDIRRRIPDRMTITVTGKCKDPDFTETFEVGVGASIGSVTSKIADIRNVKINTVRAYYNDKELDRVSKIINYVEPGTDSVTFQIKYRTTKKGKKFHERESWPSEVISEKDLPNILFQRLHNNDELVYKLLNMLKTVPASHELLKPVFSGIIPQNVFNLSDPYFFLYNMTTLDNYFAEDQKRNEIQKNITNGEFLSFFLVCIDSIISSNKINEYVYSEIIFEILRLFQNCTNVPGPVLCPIFIAMMNLANVVTDPLMIKHINKVITKIFKDKKKSIPFPGESFIPSFNLLLSEEKNKRELALKAFNTLLIPISVFASSIRDLGNNITKEFLECLNSHVNDSKEVEEVHQLALVMFGLINDSDKHLDIILRFFNSLLSFGMLPKEFLPDLTKFLIDKFLVFDMSRELKASFMSAVLCLINLTSVKEEGETEPLLHKALSKHHTGLGPFSSFSTRLDNCLISEANKVGLTNLGATCYMESSLQQLFAIPVLRNIIINYKGDNEVVTELSKLFTRLLYSTGKAESLSGLVEHFKWWGSKLNPHEQQDAVEFIEILISSYLMDNPDIGPQMKKICQGRMNYHVDGMGVDYHATSSQDFTCVELEINSDTKVLEDCIANFNHANYFTEQTGRYKTDTLGEIDATRRCFIGVAPPVLIFHLKRFAYDYAKQQRSKIATPLAVPLTLDISPAAETKQPPYKLNGVVVHRGINALGGHYVSYTAREDGKWTLFNDDDVSIVSEKQMLKEVNGSDTSVGYILFYIHDEVMNESVELNPDESVMNDIKKKNEENRLKTLYFTDPYYDLMQSLSSQVTHEYDDIVQLFSIDMLPFSQFGSRCKDFMDNVSAKTTSLFVDSLTEEYFKLCLFDCPHEQYRTGFCKLIQKSLTEENCEKIFNVALQLVDGVLSDYTHLDAVFNVIYSILSINDNVFNKYREVTSKKIFSFILEDIPAYLMGHESMKRSYFFGGLNISYILFICTKFEDVPKEMKNDAFLVDIAASMSSAKSIAEYVKKFYTEEQFIQFIKSQAFAFKPEKLFKLLTCAVPECCVSFFLMLPVQKIRGDDQDHDRSTEIAVCAATSPETREAILNNRDIWLERFLVNDNPSVRQNAQAIVSHIIGAESLKVLSSISINQEMFIQQPQFIVNKDKEEIKRLVPIFIDSIMSLIPKLEKSLNIDAKSFKNTKDVKPVRANELIELLEALLDISPQKTDITPLLSLIKPISIVGQYSNALTQLLTMFLMFNVPINESYLVSCVKGARFVVKKAHQINEFIEKFIPLCRKLPGIIPQDIISFFITQIAFAKTKNIKKAFPVIRNFLEFLCQNIYKTEVISYIRTKLSVVCKQNLPNVCIALTALNNKMDLVKYLEDALYEETLISQEELIKMVFQLKTKPIYQKEIADILDIDFLSDESRKFLINSVMK